MSSDAQAVILLGAIVAAGAACVAYGVSASAWVGIGTALIVWPIATYTFAKSN